MAARLTVCGPVNRAWPQCGLPVRVPSWIPTGKRWRPFALLACPRCLPPALAKGKSAGFFPVSEGKMGARLALAAALGGAFLWLCPTASPGICHPLVPKPLPAASIAPGAIRTPPPALGTSLAVQNDPQNCSWGCPSAMQHKTIMIILLTVSPQGPRGARCCGAILNASYFGSQSLFLTIFSCRKALVHSQQSKERKISGLLLPPGLEIACI